MQIFLQNTKGKQHAQGKRGLNYYAHGPLARVEYGNNHVQGIDYYYTIQGWIKGVNSNILNPHNDGGRDGLTTTGNSNAHFAKDAFGYTLGYFSGDYSPIDTSKWNTVSKRFEANTASSNLLASRNNLYNGNISHMVTTITKPTFVGIRDSIQFVPLPQGTAYKYDQLNRLVEMKAWQNINTVNNSWNSGTTYAGMYYNKFSYDANGSILTALAKNQAGDTIDRQTYHYQKTNGQKQRNRVYAINDLATHTSGEDLLQQVAFDSTVAGINVNNNYSYTQIGELKSDKQDSITNIDWTVYGKMKSVTRASGSHKYNLKFDYDAAGARIAKHVYTSNNTFIKSEYYVKNAEGAIMSTYVQTNDTVAHTSSFTQTEKHIYGSTSLGIETTPVQLIGATGSNDTSNHYLGYKHYTGSNHLGNVLVTFSDIKLPLDTNANDTIDLYWPDVIASNDYMPFGSLQAERTFKKGIFPNTFNGKRDDAELDWQDYGMRPYMPKGRIFPTYDPLFKKYPELTPYQFASNRPIEGIDQDGLELAPPIPFGTTVPLPMPPLKVVKGLGRGIVDAIHGFRDWVQSPPPTTTFTASTLVPSTVGGDPPPEGDNNEKKPPNGKYGKGVIGGLGSLLVAAGVKSAYDTQQGTGDGQPQASTGPPNLSKPATNTEPVKTSKDTAPDTQKKLSGSPVLIETETLQQDNTKPTIVLPK